MRREMPRMIHNEIIMTNYTLFTLLQLFASIRVAVHNHWTGLLNSEAKFILEIYMYIDPLYLNLEYAGTPSIHNDTVWLVNFAQLPATQLKLSCYNPSLYCFSMYDFWDTLTLVTIYKINGGENLIDFSIKLITRINLCFGTSQYHIFKVNLSPIWITVHNIICDQAWENKACRLSKFGNFSNFDCS